MSMWSVSMTAIYSSAIRSRKCLPTQRAARGVGASDLGRRVAQGEQSDFARARHGFQLRQARR
jgi:hypothetical protein